jgi:uroporphyrinogen-III synthase
MHILITRPRDDAEMLAAELAKHGHTTIVEPLIEIDFIDGPPLDLANVQALLLTSANGVRAAAKRTNIRNLPVIAVGPATADAARALRFTNVSESKGEGVQGLAAHVRDTLKPKDGTLLHATGTMSAGDLTAALAPAGFTVRREQLYDAVATETLSGALVAELGADVVDAALFFSPRTAKLFVDLIRDADLGNTCRRMTAFTLSRAVADALRPLSFRRVVTAPRPTGEALIQALSAA